MFAAEKGSASSHEAPPCEFGACVVIGIHALFARASYCCASLYKERRREESMSKLIYESNAHIDVNCIDRKRTKTQDHIFERNVHFYLAGRTYLFAHGARNPLAAIDLLQNGTPALFGMNIDTEGCTM